MNTTIETILNWSEIWVLLFPMLAMVSGIKQPKYLFPVMVYVVAALWLNGLIEMVGVLFDTTSESHQALLNGLKKFSFFREFYQKLTPAHKTNVLFYNAHTLCRFVCFVVFFLSLKNDTFKKVYYGLLILFVFIFIIYFAFMDSFFNPNYISSDFMAGEAFFLICFCMLFYLSILREEPQSFWTRKDFWVVTGLCFFSTINFFLFLFYQPLLNESKESAIGIWDVFNISYIIFIIFITKAFYVPASDKL